MLGLLGGQQQPGASNLPGREYATLFWIFSIDDCSPEIVGARNEPEDKLRQLGQLEATVMQRVWDWNRPTSVREVVEHLQRDRPIAYTTILTVLDNLHRKGFVTRHKNGRAYLYAAVLTREQHTARLLEAILDSESNREGTLLHFVGQMTTEQLDELRAAIDSLED